MKFSDAIILGSTMAKLNAGAFHHDDGSACAVGAAELAVGIKTARSISFKEQPDNNEIWRTHIAAGKYWPWLNNPAMACPCNCGFQEWCLGMLVTHIFDCHVSGLYKISTYEPWTLEQLVDWIKTVEPADNPAPAQTLTTEAATADKEILSGCR